MAKSKTPKAPKFSRKDLAVSVVAEEVDVEEYLDKIEIEVDGPGLRSDTALLAEKIVERMLDYVDADADAVARIRALVDEKFGPAPAPEAGPPGGRGHTATEVARLAGKK